MRDSEVPQEGNSTLGGHRKALYARFSYSQRFSRIDPWAERVAGRHAEEFNPLSRRMEFAPS